MSDDRQIPTTAPSDRPSFKILANGTQVSAEYQVQALTVAKSVNRVSSADLMILDGDPASQDFKVSNADDFVPGSEIEIQAGYHGDEETVFKGLVIRHGLRVFKNRPALLRVECRDAAVKLTVGRKSAYFYDVSDSDVIEELAGNAGLQTDVESTDVSHAQMVQFSATDWDFIVTRAEANGRLVLTRNGTLVVKAPDSSSEPVLSLSYGGNLLDFEAFMDARDQYAAVQSFSWDAANQEMLEIDGEDATADSPGNVTHADLASVIGLPGLQLKHGGQVRDDELQAWANGQRARSAFAKARGRLRVQGVAAVEPGDTIELGGVGERFNGKALVAGVRHEIDTDNWETDISFGLSPDWFARTAPNVSEAGASGLLPPISGLQIGLVTSLEDPDGEDRVQVRIPMIDPSEEGVWARVASLDAGEARGAFFRPEIGDEVILGFLNDDPRNPILLGMLNSSAKPAPIPAADDNHEKGFVTRSEMMLIFNDEKKTLALETPAGNTLLLSEEDGGIKLADQNDNSVVLDSSGITIDSAADVTIKASGDVNIEGSNISSTANAQYKAEGSAGAEVSSGGSTVVKGSMVQIN